MNKLTKALNVLDHLNKLDQFIKTKTPNKVLNELNKLDKAPNELNKLTEALAKALNELNRLVRLRMSLIKSIHYLPLSVTCCCPLLTVSLNKAPLGKAHNLTNYC